MDDDLTVDMPPLSTTSSMVFTREAWRKVVQRLDDLRAENAALRERLAAAERERNDLEDRIEAEFDKLKHIIGEQREQLAAAEQREQQARPLVQKLASAAWSELADDNGAVWCQGCGVQLYALDDDFTSEHRDECPVTQARAWLADRAEQRAASQEDALHE